jgi:hypothetical protein
MEAKRGATLTENDGAFGKIFEGDGTTYKISRIAPKLTWSVHKEGRFNVSLRKGYAHA